MTEQCWVLMGRFHEEQQVWHVTLNRPVSGEPASVEADWRWAMAQDEEHGNIAGFAHTHPNGAGTIPSSRDIRTMQAWCSALGKPLLCLIDEGDHINDPAAYIFTDDQSTGKLTTAFEILDTILAEADRNLTPTTT